MGIQINGQTDTISAVDGALTVSGADLPTVTNLNATGIVTATGFVGNITGNINATGVSTIATLNVTQSNPTNLNVSGVTTTATLRATSIVGVTTAGITTAYISSINQSQIGGRRNLIYNGEAMVDQRGSASSPVTFADSSYFADRWRCQITGSVTATVSQSGIGVTTTSDGSFQKSLNVTCTTSSTPSAGHHASIGQRLERTDVSCLGWGTSSALPVTLSFYVRSSKTGIYSISILGGDGANYGYVFEYTISSANTWQKVTKTITGPTVGTWTPGTVTGLYLNFILNNGGSGSAGTLSSLDTWTAGNYYAGSPNNVNFFDTNGTTFYITGVQLEVGTVATPFERRSYGQELALCERYYWRLTSAGAPTLWGAAISPGSDANLIVYLQGPRQRTTPTVSSSGASTLGTWPAQSGGSMILGSSYYSIGPSSATGSHTIIEIMISLASSPGTQTSRFGFRTATAYIDANSEL